MKYAVTFGKVAAGRGEIHTIRYICADLCLQARRILSVFGGAMELRHNLTICHKQSLAITPQVIQSIKLLQYSQAELEAFVQEQVERNPFLELPDRPAPAGGDAAGNADPLPRGVPKVAQSSRSGHSSAPRVQGVGSGDFAADLDSYCAARRSLLDHLQAQIGMAISTPSDRLIACELIGALDPDGYLRAGLGEIAARLGSSVEKVERVLKQVQGFEPAGIAARDLRECLSIQLADLDRLDPVMQSFLDNLHMLERYDMQGLAKACGVDLDEVAEMLAEIRALDPRPGRQFDSAPVAAALPDVQVVSAPDGSYVVELNTSLLPRVLVDREYHATVSRSLQGTDEKRFVMDCMRDANWLAKKVDQRAQTILRVAAEIVACQTEFLEKGVEFLRPLTLKEVATTLGVHRSTISRAVSNKYIMTARGMFELKYFFASSIGAAQGDDALSGETVRFRIGAMIKAEPPRAVLSDEAIAGILQREGVDIARRTVAKYREMLNIPSSQKRRRQKKMMLATCDA